MGNKLKILFLLLLLINLLQAQVSEYEYKAAFIERFTRFVEWPHEFKDSTFKIAVIGKNPFKSSLDELFTDIKIKEKNVEIIYTNNINDLAKVNLVFISSSEKKRIKEIITTISEKPILIISDTKGFAEKGIHIDLFLEEEKLKYEINPEALKKSGLKAGYQLIQLAKVVKSEGGSK